MLGRIEERQWHNVWRCDGLRDVGERAQLTPELSHAADRLAGAMQFDEAARGVADTEEGRDVCWRMRRPGLPGFEKLLGARLRQAPGDSEHHDLRDSVNLEAK